MHTRDEYYISQNDYIISTLLAQAHMEIKYMTYNDYKFKPDEILEYFRKSRKDDPAQSIEEVLSKHRQTIDKWEEENLSGKVPFENIYMERVSGETIKDRAEFQKLLRHIESPDIKAVVVVDPERLTRGDLEDAGKVINAFRYSKTLVITPTKTYDLCEEADLMLFEMKLKQGNQYLEYTKIVQARGKINASMKGCFIGNVAPFGYKKTVINKMKTLEFDENIVWLRKMYELADQGKGNRYIAVYLTNHGVPTPGGKREWDYNTVNYVLKNETNIGKIKWATKKTTKVLQDGEVIKKRVKNENHVLIDGLHPAAVSEEVFYRIQKKKNNFPRISHTHSMRNPLSGLCFCVHDGYAMVARETGGKLYLTCKQQRFCHNGSACIDDILQDISKIMKNAVRDFEIKMESQNNDSLYNDYTENVESLKKRIQLLSEKELKLWNDRYDSSSLTVPDDVFEKISSNIANEKKELTNRLEFLKRNPPKIPNYKECIKRFSEVSDAIIDESLDAESKNIFLKSCIERINYHRSPGKQGKTPNSYESRPFLLDISFKLL